MEVYPSQSLDFTCLKNRRVLPQRVRNVSYRTAKEWREHHANYFAAAVAMPKSTFVPFVKKMIAVQDFGEDLTSNTFALFFTEYLPKIISDAYGVSKQAAYVRLCKFGFDRLKKKSQLALF